LRAAICPPCSATARRNRTDFYKLLARHQPTPEEFKQR
jgi:hypothetical protein